MKILSCGEIIWDCFPDSRCLGGAPLNFAVHAARLGAQSHILSAIGADDTETLAAVRAHGVETDLIGCVPFPTGYTNITLDSAGNPTYEVIHDVAWDNIPTPPDLPEAWDAVYFGTLAQRSPVSAKTLEAVLGRVEAREFFCDLNLRHKFWSPDGIDFCLRHATLVKVNRHEREALPEDVFKKYPQLRAVLVTLDREGAMLLLPDGRAIYSEAPRAKVVSAVGAGDSFAAAFLVSWLNGREPEACLSAGIKLADRIVAQLGAI